jgi:hypothetical protein
MPHARTWRKSLSRIYGEEKALALICAAQARYTDLWAIHSAERNRRNRAALKTRILPGLALYQTLLDQNHDRPKTLADVDLLFRAAFFAGMVPGIRILSRLPDPFPLVKLALQLMARQEYLPGSVRVVEDTQDCFAMNVYRCMIFDTLTAHGAPELTALFCNTDDWLAEEMPNIRWERTQTLGRGGDRCDFCWRRIE